MCILGVTRREKCFFLSTFSSESSVLSFQWRSRKLKVQVLIFFRCVDSLRAEERIQCYLDLRQSSWLKSRSISHGNCLDLRVHMLLRIKKQQRHKGPECFMSKDLEERWCWTRTKSSWTERLWCSKADSEERKVQSSGGKIIIVCSWSWRKQNLVPRAVMGIVSP